MERFLAPTAGTSTEQGRGRSCGRDHFQEFSFQQASAGSKEGALRDRPYLTIWSLVPRTARRLARRAAPDTSSNKEIPVMFHRLRQWFTNRTGQRQHVTVPNHQRRARPQLEL